MLLEKVNAKRRNPKTHGADGTDGKKEVFHSFRKKKGTLDEKKKRKKVKGTC